MKKSHHNPLHIELFYMAVNDLPLHFRGGRFGFRFSEGAIYFFSETSRPALRLTQPPIDWVLASLPGRVERPGHLRQE